MISHLGSMACGGVPHYNLAVAGHRCPGCLGQPMVLDRPSRPGAPQMRRHAALAAQRDDSVEVLWQQRRQLESMLRMSDPKAEQDEMDAASKLPYAPNVIRDLPLWRIQTAVLPGAQEVLHVHVPWYTYMFEQIMAGPRPWRFGHVHLPGGSTNLGNPEYELRPGTAAPLVGTLMEVLSSLWTKDGRLLVLAVGVARIRVVAARQAVPYSRADVELMPDREEAAAQTEAAMRALDACNAGGEADMAAVMRTVQSASVAAAAAAGVVWHDYELAPLRALVREEDSSNVQPGQGARSSSAAAEDGRFAPPKLLWRSIVASMQGLRFGGGAPVGQDQFVLLTLPHQLSTGSKAKQAARAALADMHSKAEEAAWDAALQAARAGLLSGAAASSRPGEIPARINSTRDRGIASMGASEATMEELDAARRTSAEAAGPSQQQNGVTEVQEVLLVEGLIWQTLDSIALLAAKARKVVPEVLLPPSLLALRPPGNESALSSAAESIAVSSSGNAGSVSGSSSTANESLQATPASVAPEPIASRDAQPSEAALESRGEEAGVVEPAEPSRQTEAEYPPLRRAQRLSYALATALQKDFSHADGRQAVLEAVSTAGRLQLLLEALVRQRNTLQALAALRVAEEG